ncbi:MAG TPA: ABC transporter substrate-binding protein [Methylibium sp.]|uniref:ABC transporter substrate-binding protein n=1 Tax=Methylibium sp. TaxID=2067992 RepID=UPI002DB9538B|nr:ABC transporter substrate-binding protein [Methylibium sp.]HEU4458300.1 ABC transporter substrate-binding protein [Methylibium sp.]
MKRFGIGAVLSLALFGASAQVLTVCTEAAFDGFDPSQYTSAVTRDAIGATIFDQLMHNDRKTGEAVPALAEKMEVAPDGLSYTARLRKGVKFQTTPWFKPTRDMNADDVMFSVNRLMDRNSPWRAVTKGGFIAWDAYGPAEYIKSVEKLDDMTVRFHLKKRNAAFIEHFANYNEFSVYSAEYGAQLMKAGTLEKINTEPVGTGPWQLRSYQKDAVLRLSAHPNHWRGKQPIETLVFAITLDANVRVQKLKAGECLVGSNMRAETIESLKGAPVEVLGRTALLSGFIPLNTQRKWLSDKRFREALWLGFDKATWIKSVYAGRARPAASFIPPDSWGHDASLANRYDPERAKALVRASGYDGSELEIATRIGGSIDGKRAAELMQADWARIGVKTRIQMIEWGEMLKRTGNGNFDISFLNWIGSVDPDGFLTPVLTCAALAGGNNRSQWCNKDFDAQVDAGLNTNDRAKRIELYKKAQRILYDEVPLIPTVYPEYFTVVNKRVKGFVAGPLADLDFRGVSVGAP